MMTQALRNVGDKDKDKGEGERKETDHDVGTVMDLTNGPRKKGGSDSEGETRASGRDAAVEEHQIRRCGEGYKTKK